MPQGNSLMTSRKCNKQNREFTATDNGRTTTGRDGTDRQTNGLTLYRYLEPAAYMPTNRIACLLRQQMAVEQEEMAQTDRQTDGQTDTVPLHRHCCIHANQQNRELTATDGGQTKGDGTDGQTDGRTDTVPLPRPCRIPANQQNRELTAADGG